MVQEMYVRSLSTRDIEDLFRDIQGELLLSRSAVSEMTEALGDEYEAFGLRDLSGFEVGYLFLDEVYESMRVLRGPNEEILVACGITAEERWILLHLLLGNKGSQLRDMVKRGLNIPLTIPSYGTPGLIRAIEEIWPRSLKQHCLVHKMRNNAPFFTMPS